MKIASDVTKRRADIKSEYGVDIGISGALFILILSREINVLVTSIEKAANKINDSHKPLLTTNPKAALLFGVGRSAPILLTILLLWLSIVFSPTLLGFDVVGTLWGNKDLRLLLEYGEFHQQDDGHVNLVLYPRDYTKKQLYGQTYEYNSSCKCVIVPIR